MGAETPGPGWGGGHEDGQQESVARRRGEALGFSGQSAEAPRCQRWEVSVDG